MAFGLEVIINLLRTVADTLGQHGQLLIEVGLVHMEGCARHSRTGVPQRARHLETILISGPGVPFSMLDNVVRLIPAVGQFLCGQAALSTADADQFAEHGERLVRL